MRNRFTLGVVALAALVLASCGGDEPEETAPVDLTETVDVAPEPDAVALASALDAWAGPVRELGYAVAYQEGSAGALTDIVVGNPDGTRWASASARIVDVSDGVLELRPEGTETLIIQLGDPVFLPVAASSVRIAVVESGAMAFEWVNATLGSSAIASMTVRASADETQIDVSDLVLAEGAGGPLGSTITTINGVVTGTTMEGGQALTFSSLAFRWGLFDFTGSGVLSVDEVGTWSGLLDGEVLDALALLDSFRAYEALDRDALAEVYAALLEEIATAEGGLMLSFQIDAGSIMLLGEDRGVPDLNLGSNVPVLAGIGQP